MNTLSCHVKNITPFNDSVYQVILRPETPFEFKAGQYLSVVMGDADKRPFSIASAPHASELELHVGAAVTESYPMQVVEKMRRALADNRAVTIEAPAGNAFLRAGRPRPKLLAAGGTGFSYIKSIIEDLIEKGETAPVTFYWGCRTPRAMYYKNIADGWNRRYEWLTFVPVAEEADNSWTGKTGNLLARIRREHNDVSAFDIYIAGRFDMAAAARDMLRALNVNENHLYGDAFDFMK